MPLVVGARPPVMGSAWVVLAYSFGVLLQRPTHAANTFALAWLGVALANPADLLNAGCQLSFLAVAVLIWGIPRRTEPADPLEQLVAASRPWPLTVLINVLRWIGTAYLINTLVWLAVTPLAAAHFHLISPVALDTGPFNPWQG